MSDECQVTNADATAKDITTVRIDEKEARRRGFTVRNRGVVDNPAIQLKAATLRGAGYTVEAIAKELGISYVTAYKLVKVSGVDDVLKRATKTVRSAIPQIAKMTTREIIDKKDRRLGFEVLKEAGVIAEAGPQRDKVESGRITFEFNFPPPPWAPSAVVEASKPKAIDVQVEPSESSTQLHALDAPVDVPPRD